MKRKAGPEPPPIVIMILGILIYAAACLLVFNNGYSLERIKKRPVTHEFVRRAFDLSFLYDATFFLKMAERLQASPQDFKAASESFGLSLVKAPTRYDAFLAGGQYLILRRCCREAAVNLFREAVERNPTDFRTFEAAGRSMLKAGWKEEAYPFLKRAIALSPSISSEIYKALEAGGAHEDELMLITPNKTESLIQLSSYVASKGRASEQLKQLLNKLVNMPLLPKERLAVAQNSFRVGVLSIARNQAVIALKDENNRMGALLLLLDIDRTEGNWEAFEETTLRIESGYRNRGQAANAAACLMAAAEKFSSAGKNEKAIEMLRKITTQNPEYAAAYFRLAQLQKKDDPPAAHLYLRKALELKPYEFEYARELAELDLKLLRFHEAEEIYAEFIENSKYREAAYLGLASCKESAGEPIEAILILERGMNKVGKTKSIVYALARQYESLQNYDKAAELYLEYVTLTPQNPAGYLRAAEMYQKAGKYSFAKKRYKQAIALDPQNKEAHQGLLQLSSN